MDFLKELGIMPHNPGVSTGAAWLPGGGEIVSFSPVDGQQIATATTTDAPAYEAVILTAAKAFEHWRTVPAPQRGEVVRQIGEALRRLIRAESVKNAIIFCNKKTTVRDLYTSLRRSGFRVGQIHGDMEQPPASPAGPSSRTKSISWSRPTSRRAAWTSRASAMSSISTCPGTRTTMSTASAAPAARAPRASPIRSRRRMMRRPSPRSRS